MLTKSSMAITIYVEDTGMLMHVLHLLDTECSSKMYRWAWD